MTIKSTERSFVMNFNYGTCPKCGAKHVELMTSNNPLDGGTICFNCIRDNLVYTNLEHANFFCRTYNLPFNPELWIQLANEHQHHVFKQYAAIVLDDAANQPNLAYSDSTKDLWSRTTKE